MARSALESQSLREGRSRHGLLFSCQLLQQSLQPRQYLFGLLLFQRELQHPSRRELGSRFDLRRFHNALLDNGPLPLALLGHEIEGWITAERGGVSP